MTDIESARPSTSELYVVAYNSFVELARTLTTDEWAKPVPCTPGWDARDVLSHVFGVVDDALAGRMDGAISDEWTAAQVERNRDLSVDELLDRWDSQAQSFADALDAINEPRPPFDCHSHEYDLRHAIGKPGSNESVIIEMAGMGLASGLQPPFSITIELSDGRTVSGGDSSGSGGDGVVLRNVSTFELFRSRLGRRTLDQARTLDWEGAETDIDRVLEDWFMFGPSLVPIDE